MIPIDGSSESYFQPSPSMEENIESLTRMLTGSPLSYEKEVCNKLFDSIQEKLPQTSQFQDVIETIAEMINNPLEYDRAYIQETLFQLRGIN